MNSEKVVDENKKIFPKKTEKNNFKKGDNNYAKVLSPSELKTLMQELQLHQIELEMQNDELRKAQETIEISRKRYSDLYNYAPVGYLTIDSNGVILEANLTALKLFQYDKSIIIGKPIVLIVKQEDLHILYEHLQALKNGVSHICQLQIVKQDKKTFDAELMSVPFVDYEKNHQYLITVFDITMHKQAIETKSRLAAIVDGTDDAIISRKLDGSIISWNKGAEKMYGFTEKEIIGQNIALLKYGEKIHDSFDVKTTEAADTIPKQFETIHKRKDGTLFPISITKSKVMGEHDDVVGVSLIVRDITNQKKWEDSMIDLNQQFQASNHNLKHIASTLSHELRGPLQGLISVCKCIDDECAKVIDHNCKQYLKQIHTRAVNIDNVVVRLLEISAITHAKLTYKKVNLSALIVSVINETCLNVPPRKYVFNIQERVWVNCDKILLRIAIEKIIQNAIKFTKNKRLTEIVFGTIEKEKTPVYFIRDNGAGFDMKNKDKLFTILQRLHDESEFEGSGIGLSTAQKIFKSHGGEIWAEGEVGKGATFYFTLGK